MKRGLASIALIAALALTGCSGVDSRTDQVEEAGNGSQPAAEETPQTQQLDRGQLKQIIESTDVDGQSFKSVDMGEDAGSKALKALENDEYEPAECKELSVTALNAAKASNGNTLAGTSADKSVSVALMSLNDENAAESQMQTSTKIVDQCSEVTIKSQGLTMTMAYTTFDATVAGADETVGLRAKIDAGKQTVLNTDTVTSRVGNNIVTAANITDSGDEQTVSKTAEAFVDAFKNAG